MITSLKKSQPLMENIGVFILDKFDLRALPNPHFCSILVIERRRFPGIGNKGGQP
jgi:hypothetical protein